MNSKFVAALAFSLVSVASHASIVSNSGFETNNLSTNDYKYSYTGVSSTDWGFTGYAGVISDAAAGSANSSWGSAAASGNAFGFVQSYSGGGSSLFQTFNLTSSGSLALSFDLASRSGSTQSLSVSIDNLLVWSGTTSSTSWSLITASPVTLSSGSHTLTFASSVPVVAGDNTAFVDNVALTPLAAVPEPETFAMLLAGLGMVGFIAKRRQPRQG